MLVATVECGSLPVRFRSASVILRDQDLGLAKLDCLLGIDIGTSGVKAAVFGTDGEVLGTGVAKIERLKDQPLGRDLHDPRDWWRQTVVAVREALSGIAFDHGLRGIACCGFHHVPIFLNQSAEPAMPVVMIHDRELPASRERPREDGRLDTFHEATKSFISAAHLPSIAEQSRRSFPEQWQQVRHVLLSKNYMRFRLTGINVRPEVSRGCPKDS